MPVMVEWQWQNDTQTFLVVFHIFDDYSRTNLRGKIKPIPKGKIDFGENCLLFLREVNPELKAVITWAPSHPEVANMAEVLLIANIINGYSLLGRAKIWFVFNSIYDEDGGFTQFLFNLLTASIWEYGNSSNILLLNTEYLTWLSQFSKKGSIEANFLAIKRELEPNNWEVSRA